MALTKRKVDAAKWNPAGRAQQIVYDEQTPGFGVRLYPSGKKSWVLWLRTRSGRKRLATVGRVGVMTLEQARKRARRMLLEVADGADPVAERKADGEARTVRELAALYVDRHARPHRKSWREDKRRLDTHVVPALRNLPIAAVKRSDVAALHARIGANTPVEANRVLELVRAALNKAEEWGLVPEGTPNPAAKVKRFRERSRERWVLPSEMPALLESIEGEENVFIRAALRLYLLTGLRKSELLRARWADVDLERAEWRIPNRKGGESLTVPLPGPAVVILRDLPRFAGNPHVFPGHKRGTHLRNIDKNWRAVRERAGLPDVTLHDLRRTVGSWMATAGESLQVVGQVLGHAPGDVAATAIYARLLDDGARRALEEHAARLLAAAEANRADE